MVELWVEKDGYMISNHGRIKNKHGRELKLSSGYVNIKGKMYRVKNLIAHLFLNVELGSHVRQADPGAGFGVDNLIIKG